MGSEGKKKDFFGRPVKEKFPHYPYSVIIPRCGPGPPCASTRSRRRAPANDQKTRKCPPEDIKVECCSQEIRPRPKMPSVSAPCETIHPGQNQKKGGKKSGSKLSSSQKRSVNTKELCERIAEIVAQEIPQIDDKFLKEIQDKCKRYWDCLLQYNVVLDEEAVFQILKEKIREWAENNSLHEVKPGSENGVEFVESEEDLEELYGTVMKYSDSRFDSHQQLYSGEDE